MTTLPKDGGPAFPQTYDHLACGQCGHLRKAEENGMSLRDWFAGMVLNSFAGMAEPERVAADAYKHADAMLAERSKTP